jgi:surface antigen
MTRPTAALLLSSALALAGCDVTGSNSPGTGSLARAFSAAPSGSANGRGEQAAAAAVSDAALGGMLGAKIGARLDAEDRRLASQAQIEALERGAPGAPVPWRNPASGHYGNIVPGPAYVRQGSTCRGYSHSISIAGQFDTSRGTACRVSDGPWSAATS